MISKIRCIVCLALCLLLLVACINLGQEDNAGTTARGTSQSVSASVGQATTATPTTEKNTAASTVGATEDPFWTNATEDGHTKRY